ncbi:hypothetical protein [Paenibacillus gansuensis]|uniref:Uncharacterized protein n=1 Tax=Paenibacillus gansuensis TaxID=306542 RepID=A0ABW5PHK7_9BACL
MNFGILDLIRGLIDAGYYVHLNIDESVIPQSPKYKKGPYYHPIFIYGYNNLTGKFKISGYFNHHKYEFIEADYALIEKGYELAKADKNSLWINRLQLYKVNPSANYIFDIECVVEGLREYCLSIPSDRKIRHFENPDPDAKFGLQTYDCMEEHIETIATYNYPIDLRPFHIIWEHKKVMVSRLNYMMHDELNLKEFINQYSELEKETNSIKDTALKFKITEDMRLLNNLSKSLKKIHTREKYILEELISTLEKNNQKLIINQEEKIK